MFAASHVGHEVQHGQPQLQGQPLHAGDARLEFFRIYALRVNGIYVQFVSDRLDPNRCYALIGAEEFGPSDEASVAERVVEAIQQVRHAGQSAARPC